MRKFWRSRWKDATDASIFHLSKRNLTRITIWFKWRRSVKFNLRTFDSKHFCFSFEHNNFVNMNMNTWIANAFFTREIDGVCLKQKVYLRTVPNYFKFWLFMYFKKVSRKETGFNQSNGRKFKNSLFAQGISLPEQRDYF